MFEGEKIIRPYPRNSAQAAARIVALAALADGTICTAEFNVLDRLRAGRQFGLSRTEFHGLVHTLCADLLAPARLSGADMCRVDDRALAGMMAEVDETGLRLKVMRLCISVIEADGLIADGESLVLAAAARHWGLSPELAGSKPETRATEHV